MSGGSTGRKWWQRFEQVRDSEQHQADWRIRPFWRVRRRDVIQCRTCKRPAWRVDGYYPYYNDYTLCRKHWEAQG